ncbi:MAG: hypothetical protein SGI96_14760 [Bacteroidota bacterium]|nr:hypothetical protein [Bacteroidota bacterium]
MPQSLCSLASDKFVRETFFPKPYRWHCGVYPVAAWANEAKKCVRVAAKTKEE